MLGRVVEVLLVVPGAEHHFFLGDDVPLLLEGLFHNLLRGDHCGVRRQMHNRRHIH